MNQHAHNWGYVSHVAWPASYISRSGPLFTVRYHCLIPGCIAVWERRQRFTRPNPTVTCNGFLASPSPEEPQL